jgi:hypothetical protein
MVKEYLTTGLQKPYGPPLKLIYINRSLCKSLRFQNTGHENKVLF